MIHWHVHFYMKNKLHTLFGGRRKIDERATQHFSYPSISIYIREMKMFTQNKFVLKCIEYKL